MSIVPIQPEDVEYFSLETSPSKTYTSSSISGITGSSYVFPRRSLIEKEIFPLSIYSASLFQDHDLSAYLKKAKVNAMTSGSNQNDIQNYLDSVSTQPSSVRKQQKVEIIRFTPGFGTSINMNRKETVVNCLYPYYRHIYPSANYAFTNYNSLNFLTCSSFPESSVLLYPQRVTLNGLNVVSSSYCVTGAFSFDFWIKPKNTTDTDFSFYKPGTILSLTGCYAISLHSGSSRDVNGRPDKFRISFQLGNDANTPPYAINTSSLSTQTYMTDDNSLLKDVWHHVTIRWGTNIYNLGSGSILVDGISRNNFSINSSSLIVTTTASSDGPVALCLGNFYEGKNITTESMARFFAADPALRDGLLQLDSTIGIDYPVSYSFTHPLNAELHDVKIYTKYLIDDEISALRSNGPTSFNNLIFYVPPFFTYESPTREIVGNNGGVFVTPFQAKNGTTTTPFSAELAFEVGGHYINLENFTSDFAGRNYPRLIGLTGSIVTAPTNFPQTANTILYSTSSVRRRSLTILPCDNGNFFPNYALLKDYNQTYFHNDLYVNDLSLVSIRDSISSSSLLKLQNTENINSIAYELMGPNPNDSSTFGKTSNYVPTILQRTKDNNSNQVVFFDCSTLFYDQNIEPGSLILYDSSVSGSNKSPMILKDDGYGNVYRSDVTGSVASYNGVGNIFYNEGIIILKHPSLFFFGENQFQISFKGRHDIHVYTINCTARSNLITSSSNPSFIESDINSNVNEDDQKYVWISDVLIHDQNLNVLGRSKLAQHFPKKSGDKLLIKYKIDY